MYLVWVKQPMGAPMAQIWMELNYGKDSDKKENVLQIHKLTDDEMNIGINTLKKVYPLNQKE